MEFQLKNIRQLKGTIVLKSGLHIGSGNMEMQIGGTDSPVIKHPHTHEPYIPGSSIKGKVRSLIEMMSGLVPLAREKERNGGGVISLETLRHDTVRNDPSLKKRAENILKIFGHCGSTAEKDLEITASLGPTRVSFADCHLNSDWREMARNKMYPLTEEKSENRIDRIQGTAEHPRFIERVPEGTKFDFTVSFKEIQKGDEELLDTLLVGLRLLEWDALGGSGSRGYGRIAFENLTLDGKNLELPKEPFKH